MIPEVDQALEALVRREALNGSRVEVLFDAPTKDWVARRNAPTIDIYLYDIREDLSRRQVVPEAVRDAATGIVGQRRMPPRRFRLSYLLTAWTQRPEDEHRLLAACLAAIVRNETIPADLVSGSLAASPYPVILQVAMPVGQDRSIADVWSAMGGELKPSLDIVAIAPLDAAWTQDAAKPVLEPLSLGVGGPGIAREAGSRRRRGRSAGDLRPEESATQAELVLGGSTGDRRNTASGTATTGKAGRRAAPDEVEKEPDEARLGSGRIIRVRGISRP